VAEAFDAPERQALERLCERLPELIPARPAALTHGDLWTGNILADHTGAPVLIDPPDRAVPPLRLTFGYPQMGYSGAKRPRRNSCGVLWWCSAWR
jgi:hypothetical protein